MRDLKKVYKEVSHTADLAIEVKGRDLEDLFRNAGLSMIDLSLDSLEKVEEKERIEFECNGTDLVDLFIRYLSELHYIIFGKLFLYSEIKIEKIDENHVKGYVIGEYFDAKRHSFEIEIKAVTYHMARVERKNGEWTGFVVFDV